MAGEEAILVFWWCLRSVSMVFFHLEMISRARLAISLFGLFFCLEMIKPAFVD